MKDKTQQKKPKAIYEPGELDRTRKNIGDIDPDEATKMTKLLGGEIGVEKTPLYDKPNIQKSKTFVRRGDINNKTKIENNVSNTNLSSNDTNVTQQTLFPKTNAKQSKAKIKNIFRLPTISSKEKSLMDKLMQSNQYLIKNQYGFFTYLIMLAKRNTDQVSESFVITSLDNYIFHMQKFISSVKQLISGGSVEFKNKVNENDSVNYRILKFINELDIQPIKALYTQLEKTANNVNIVDLIPLTKTIYQILLKLYFYGEKNLTDLFKSAYTEISKNSEVPNEILLRHTRDAATEWLYISGQVVKGLYPLLMRMCCNEYYDFPEFFSKNISKILQFLEMTKFDLFLFSKKNTKKSTQVKSNKFEQSDNENNLTDNKKVENDSQHSIIKRGLEFLDKMFPQAGWLNLENHPDMYPYFQPIYSFKDGFNLLSPKNPMQITVVLLRIIEDFFQACRNIRFSIDKEPDFSNLNDNLYDVFSEWYLYREDIYEKNYSSELKDYVNHLDTQSDFIHSPYAKKKLCTLQWQAKYSFLPNLSFELVYMEKPTKETNYKPLHKRTDYLIKVFSTLISRIDDYLVSPVNSIKEMPDFGAANIMGQYRFDVPNSISRRLNYFLGGKKSRHTINLNLLKYALCVISVLHWWISDENSPAYAYPNSEPFRKTEEGKPIFSVPIIEDANDLFIKKPTE